LAANFASHGNELGFKFIVLKKGWQGSRGTLKIVGLPPNAWLKVAGKVHRKPSPIFGWQSSHLAGTPTIEALEPS
jgi:hypothetical protein